jgi:hypothetical protein
MMLLLYDAEQFADLTRHAGHHVACVVYGSEAPPLNVSVECTDCSEVMVGMDRPADTPVTIPAEVYSDDHVLETSFDAAPWFEQASEAEILQLADDGWGSDYSADAIARWMTSHNAHVGWFLSAWMSCSLIIGFECRVDQAAALKWLAAHRPALAARLVDPPAH